MCQHIAVCGKILGSIKPLINRVRGWARKQHDTPRLLSSSFQLFTVGNFIIALSHAAKKSKQRYYFYRRIHHKENAPQKMMQHHSTLPSDIPVLRIRAVGRLAGFNGISTLGLSGIVSAETIEADETIVGVAVKLRGKTRTYTDHQSAKSASSVVQDSSHPSSHFLLHIASVVYQSPELVLFDKLPEGRCTSSTAAVKFTYNTPTHIECEFEGQIETNRRLPPTVAKHTFFEMLVTVKRQRQRQNNSLAGTSDEDFCTLHEAPQTLRDSTTSIEVTEHVFPISHIPYFDEERVTALLSPVKFTYEFEVAGHDGKS